MTQVALSLPSVDELSSADEPRDALVGLLLDGRYVVERKLGEGGMGLVYAARHHVLGRPFAIKVLRPDVSRDEGVITRFRREAQAATSIGSPHICDVSDFGTLPDGSTYFVMEYLDGPSLTDAMEQDLPLALPRLLHIATQLCDALGAAHAQGIVHRDLKPDNVHLVRRGAVADFVKVLDFGIAKVAGGADKRLTQAGQVFGTPYYMSPEQCAGRDVDPRTDVYALGVMLYEMACGQVPFEADTLLGVLTKHIYEAPVPPRELSGGAMPPGLEAVILKCLAKSADDRYASMEALRVDLDALAQGAVPSAQASAQQRDEARREGASALASALASAPPPVPARAPSRSRAALWVGAAVGALLVSGVAGAALLLTASRAPAATPPLPLVEVGADSAGERPAEPLQPVAEPIGLAELEPTPSEPVVVVLAPVALAPVELRTDPPGAEVYSSGALIGNTPLGLPRPSEGVAEYRVALPGYRAHTLLVSAQTSAEVSVFLERERRESSRPIARPVARPAPVLAVPRPLAPIGGPRPRVDSLGDGIIDPFATPRRR